MKRKAIQLAGSTLVVSLPSKWVKKYNIKKGDNILLEEKGNQIIVGSKKSISSEKTSISIVDMDPMVKRILGATYKAGYDLVDVEFEPKELEAAQEVIREEFIGFEVVYQGKNQFQIKKISSIDPDEFDTMLRRIFLIINQMAEQSLEALEKQDKGWLKTISFMDKDVNKYADFCRRILNKYGYSEFKKTPGLYYIVEQLERIGDSYRDICKHAEQGIALSDSTKQIYKEINEFYNQFYELFYKYDSNKLAKFGKKRYDLRDKVKDMLEKSKKDQFWILMYLYIIMDNTFDMNGALMAINV
ncbi:MAG: hypothetical protein MAG795_01160 [Candidatus Woesearchaeota archaeon]|nr:hypothetical protein [Candidatus Woesearchaeota archaeon]